MCKAVVLLVLLIISESLWAQKQSSLTGMVLDAQTHKPLPFAVVYFANTALGTYTREDGSFEIHHIPEGRYNFIVSLLGYKEQSHPLTFLRDTAVLQTVLITPDVIKLNEVMVKARNASYKRYYNLFKSNFIGQTPNAPYCIIVNPEDIYVDFDKTEGRLVATATEPIEVVNQALGYKVFYALQTFEVDYKKGVYKIMGTTRFENLVPKSEHEKKRWIKARDKAYYGSMNHFIRSLKLRKLTENRFEAYALTTSETHRINEDSLFTGVMPNEVHYKGYMKLIFSGEYEDAQYSGITRYYVRPQTSYLRFVEDKVMLYDNGYYENLFSIVLDGYLGWTDRIAEMVPQEYQPTTKLK